MENDYSQYGIEENDEQENNSDPNKISVIKLPLTTEIKIGNQTVTVINPEYVDKLQSRIVALERTVTNVTTELRKIKSAARLQEIANSKMSNYSDSEYE